MLKITLLVNKNPSSLKKERLDTTQQREIIQNDLCLGARKPGSYEATEIGH